MMISIGNFFFHYRNGLFPLVYALLLFKSQPLLEDYRVAALIGFVVAALGQALRAVTIGLEYIIRGGRKRQVYAEKLVQGGLFAHCRNPLYVGNFTIIVGIAIASNSLLFVSVAIPFFIFAYWAIIQAEENFLRGKFGQEFDDYCARVNRLLPNFAGLGQTLSSMTFNWRRLITAEYGSAYIWLAAIILVTLKNVWLSGEYEARQPMVLGLWVSFGVVTLSYVLARLSKKSGFLKAERNPAV
ncbi:MAG TPA: isoprenylcysteine carboxylmethyltransferase family protein [Candidatus Saccharimonadales bacterium]|nr:isoprenylcysteine carboxylmethyltransferase family protein [Candidatus Saccharimonadales bacterium]